MFKHILVPIDGSELSFNAAKYAVSFAKTISAFITVFYAKPDYPLTYYYGEGTLMDPTSPEKYQQIAEEQSEQYLNRIAAVCKELGVPCNTLSVISDLPHEAIITAAQDNHCDLIFMASHGRRGIRGLLLGSETNKVLTHTKIPVLVYR